MKVHGIDSVYFVVVSAGASVLKSLLSRISQIDAERRRTRFLVIDNNWLYGSIYVLISSSCAYELAVSVPAIAIINN